MNTIEAGAGNDGGAGSWGGGNGRVMVGSQSWARGILLDIVLIIQISASYCWKIMTGPWRATENHG